jgi:cytochrome P450
MDPPDTKAWRLPPGPKTAESEQTFAFYSRPYEFLDECATRFGDAFTLRLKGWGQTVCFVRPNAIRDLFSASSLSLQAGRANEVLRDALGRNSLILLDGTDHLECRRQLMPAFHGRRVLGYGTAIQAIARDAVATGAVGSRPLTDVLLEVSRDVILEVVFGLDRADPRHERLGVAVAGLVAAVGTTVQSAHAAGARAALDDVLREEFARRRVAPDPEAGDVLGMLLDASDSANTRSDEELRDQLVTLLMAGHETTATSLAWALVELEARPDVQSRLRAEIATAGQRPDPMELASLPYLDAVCKEVLRLRPVVPVVARWVASPVTIDGWTLPAGAHAAGCIYLMHRRADVYKEPFAFRPERFLDHEPSPWEFAPFGGGSRRCIGTAFAMYEMKVVLATILGTVDFEGDNRRPWTAVRHSVCVAPSEQARMTVKPRRSEER